MTTSSKKRVSPQVPSEEKQAELRRIAREVNARAGIPDKPTMTIDELHASMLAHGIRPEDKIFTSELLRMRYGDDYDQDEYMRQLDEQSRNEQNQKE